MLWLAVADEGCIGPSKKLMCYVKPPKNYLTHAWQNSVIVLVLARSSCSSPSAKELHAYDN